MHAWPRKSTGEFESAIKFYDLSSENLRYRSIRVVPGGDGAKDKIFILRDQKLTVIFQQGDEFFVSDVMISSDVFIEGFLYSSRRSGGGEMFLRVQLNESRRAYLQSIDIVNGDIGLSRRLKVAAL